MSKIICEICGTTYPDTADQCPTCGTEKPVTADFMDSFEETSPAAPSRDYTPTKGGRFSKSNVNKRLRADSAPQRPRQSQPQQRQPQRPTQQPVRKSAKKKTKKTERILLIAIVLQLIAIVVVMSYIYLRYFAPERGKDLPKDTTASQVQDTKPQDTTGNTAPDITTDATVPCTGINLSDASVLLDEVGRTWQLSALAEPVDTTDTITFRSGDENVATVTADGLVTAVADGEAVIYVTCGEITVECQVSCQIAPPTTEETVPPTTEDTTPPETTVAIEFEFNTKYGNEVTLSSAGEVWYAYDGDIPVSELSFRVGKSYVATVTEKGKVTAVGPGTTTLYVEYKGQEYTCLIRCSF